ncbi:hypothetical protein TNCV_4154181 [Trichonephila clavipes]|nr:hypothetical protein TNCV_4154181 [Trichonephila clavipes]
MKKDEIRATGWKGWMEGNVGRVGWGEPREGVEGTKNSFGRRGPQTPQRLVIQNPPFSTTRDYSVRTVCSSRLQQSVRRIFLAKYAATVRPSLQNSPVDAISFSPYPRHARLERDLAIWLVKDPAVKRNGTPDHNSSLKACVACNSESRIGTLSWTSPDTSSIIVRTQLEVGFIAKHYTSPVSMIPA